MVLPPEHLPTAWKAGFRHKAGSDFAGTYSSVGSDGALVGGAGGVRNGNEKGVVIALRGPKVGMEFAANIGRIAISLK